MSEVVLSRLSDKSDREKEKERQRGRERKSERKSEKEGLRGKAERGEGEGEREQRKKGEKGTVAREREGGRRARARTREGRGAGIVVVSSLQCIAFTIPRVPVTPRAPTNRVRRASHEEIHETSFAVERFGSSRFIERKSFLYA